MAGYLVLARKYRSKTFDEVVAQEPISQTLVNAIKTGRIAHAYLFTGTRGVGKTTMARIFAKALNCLSSDGPTITPCNECDACIAIGRGDDMDVIEIDGASNRGIDEIRELRANAIFRPARCRFKIYYIDEVHQITRDAFNALLKTLEEPPEHVKFIFATTEAGKVPATILSRCQRFDFRNIPTRRIAGHLAEICKAEKVSADADSLFRIARAAAGSMRDGLSLLDQLLAAGEGSVTDDGVVRILGAPPDQLVAAIIAAIADGNTADALTQLDAIGQAGVSLTSAAAALGEMFRNMMIAATCGGDSDLIELPELQKTAVAELARKFSTPTLVQAIGICQSAAFKVRTSSVARAVLEAAIVRLAEAEKFVDPASLIEQLEAMGGARPPGRAGIKKTSPAGAARQPSRPAGELAAADNQPPPPPIQWDPAWLKANWKTVIRHLSDRRQMRVAGLLGPTKVLGFEDGLLKLGFDAAGESLRQQCAGAMSGPIVKALTDLAGQSIRCEFLANEPNGNGDAPARAFGGLSTAAKAEIVKDPAIQQAMSLFGGDVVDVRKDPPPANGSADEQDKTQ